MNLVRQFLIDTRVNSTEHYLFSGSFEANNFDLRV